LFLCQWIMAQNPEDTTTTEMMSTEDEMSSTEMESTEDEMTSTFDSDSSSGSGSESGGGSMSIEGGEESDESGSSSGLSTTDDSGSSDSDEVESSEGGSSSNGGGMNPEDNNEDDGEDESASDDNDSDEDESAGDDGEAMESEEDDQDTDEESTEGPEDGDTEDNDQVDVAGEDECVGLDADECGNTFGDDGAQLCGYNTQTDDCYEVVMTVGIRGRGNFDDGYTAAQEEADEQAAQLYTAIGVLGGILALLVLTVLGGAYYVHSNRKHVDYRHTAVPHDIIDVDGGSTRTKGQHSRIESHSVHYSTDSIPMLDTN